MLTISAILLAPRYLAYAEIPRQSHAVILFVGPDYDARLREARQLIADGYAGHLLIPAFNQILQADSSGALPAPRQIENTAPVKQTANGRNRFYEDTHTEVLVARQMMERSGFRTAILVSSPYHMRRIKLIADRVFQSSPSTPLTPPLKTRDTSLPSLEGPREGESPILSSFDRKSSERTYRLHFVPTRYESAKSAFWFVDGPEFARVTSEYIKIAWFQLYSRLASKPAS